MSTDNKRNREICKNMNVEVNVCFSNPSTFESSKRKRPKYKKNLVHAFLSK